MNNLPNSGDIAAGHDIIAKNVITGIQQNFTIIFQQPFQPPADLTRLRADYLAYLQASHRYLDMRGITQVQRVTQQLALTSVYVPLKAAARQASDGDHWGRIAGRWQWLAAASGAAAELAVAIASRMAEPTPVEISLKTDPAVAVLGDPGAGKSTLLKVLTLALAEQPAGPLPILLPLNAYAKRLQQGRVNLSRFLGEYYASRQENLTRVGDLFAAALGQQQAVVLLDGLDEVQVDRLYLVRLVEDFAAEYMPQPAVAADATPVTGNRLIVTSRFVGYDEAPLAGRQWRTHYLTDFDRADIEQFVCQWTLAFALSVKGDSEPTRQEAERDRRDLVEAIFSRASVEQLAANPLLLTILALIKYIGVTLPERRVELYELYLKTFIESWNQSRALDKEPVGPLLQYSEYVRVLAPLALWLRQENPTAGLVNRSDLEAWLVTYYQSDDWGLPKGEARRRADDFLKSVEKYTNLLLERGERQYGFLHLTLEEMLAAQGIALLADDDLTAAQALMCDCLLEPTWHETLQLTVGVLALINRRPKTAGTVLQGWLELAMPPDKQGQPVLLAGEALLDVGQANVGRPVAQQVTATLVDTMQAAACSLRVRRDAGNLLGRLDWMPDPVPDDLLLAPFGCEPTGLDAFRPIQTTGASKQVWLGKYPVTNRQFARFVEADGYNRPEVWSEDGWQWRMCVYDSKAPSYLQNWLKNRPPDKRGRPYWWNDRQWNSPLYPVVGVSWFEAEAYARWLTVQISDAAMQRINEWARRGAAGLPSEIVNRQSKIEVRLPVEAEWEAAIGGRGEYPWGDTFAPLCVNCADSWTERDLSRGNEWSKWLDSEERREAGLTAVTTYPQGVSLAGLWDGCGNMWEWMQNPYDSDGETMALHGGSWLDYRATACVPYRLNLHPAYFNHDVGFRLVVTLV